MVLGFSTKINGKPTYFVEKIWKSLRPVNISEFVVKLSYDNDELAPMWRSDQFKPKLHTIREDKNDRWKPGVMIDFFINARTKGMFRFAPRVPVVSRQRIFMTYLPHLGNGFEVSIDGRQLYHSEIRILAENDGFDNINDFEDYFISQMRDDQYSAKIIHWTNFHYQ